MGKPLLVMFIGVPGSGKTFFATHLAEKLHAVRLNSDGMRLAIFGSLEEMERVYNSKNRSRINTYVFGAMDYVTKQLLSSGVSVVYEAIQRTRSDRKNMRELAAETGAIPVLVWMKVDEETAVQRVQSREATGDVRQFSEEKAREVVRHFQDNLELPEEFENVIEISGEVDFDEQFRVFSDHFITLTT